jgi:predicted nucleic acid-binding protein
VSIVVLDASAGAEIVAQTGTGKRLLALTPRNRIWWAPDHFHVEATGALRRMLMKDLITEDRAEVALRRLLRLPIHIASGRPLIPEAWTMRHRAPRGAVNRVVMKGHHCALVAASVAKLRAA